MGELAPPASAALARLTPHAPLHLRYGTSFSSALWWPGRERYARQTPSCPHSQSRCSALDALQQLGFLVSSHSWPFPANPQDAPLNISPSSPAALSSPHVSVPSLVFDHESSLKITLAVPAALFQRFLAETGACTHAREGSGLAASSRLPGPC